MRSAAATMRFQRAQLRPWAISIWTERSTIPAPLRLESGDDLVGDPPPVVEVVAARRAEDEVADAGVDVLADARLDRGRVAGQDVRRRHSGPLRGRRPGRRLADPDRHVGRD